jgi:hypothetical protein
MKNYTLFMTSNLVLLQFYSWALPWRYKYAISYIVFNSQIGLCFSQSPYSSVLVRWLVILLLFSWRFCCPLPQEMLVTLIIVYGPSAQRAFPAASKPHNPSAQTSPRKPLLLQLLFLHTLLQGAKAMSLPAFQVLAPALRLQLAPPLRPLPDLSLA